MQNKGLVKLFAFLFIAVSIYQLSFTFIAGKVEDEATEYAKANISNETTEDQLKVKYLDSVAKKPVFAGVSYDFANKSALKQGLDLKGGVNVILQISARDILTGLSNNSTKPVFTKALDRADEIQKNADETYLESFEKAYKEVNAGTPTPLASPGLFVNRSLEEDVKVGMSDDDVINVLERKLDESIESAFEVIRKRIDKFGVTSPNIQRLGKSARILVELPGAKDVTRIMDLLQKSAKLEFYETHKMSELGDYLFKVNSTLKKKVAPKEVKEETAKDSNEVEDKEQSVDDLLGEENKDDEVNPLFDIFKFNPGIQSYDVIEFGVAKKSDIETINGYLTETANLRPAAIKYAKFRWGIPLTKEEKKGYGITEDDESEYVPLIALKSDRDGKAAMSGDVVEDARQDFTQSMKVAVAIGMNANGAKQWEKITGDIAKQGNTVAIVLDNTIYSHASAKEPISGGRTEISGNFTVTQAKDLANVLRAGKLPAKAEIISSAVVGPSLGQEAIDKGMISFIIALAIVLIWMVFYYGKAGLYADVALLLNIVLIFGLLSGLGAVLTLPGIAGIVLTIGMSVDANVLIFERIREELAAGKNSNRSC